MIIKAIKNAMKVAERKKWTKTYWAVDIHGTMIVPNFETNNIPKEFYPHALEVLQELTKRKDVVLILYTCSHPHELEQYNKYFHSHSIHFDHVNENPEVETADYGCFDSKIYFNILFEDKAGFDPETDWLRVKEILKEI